MFSFLEQPTELFHLHLYLLRQQEIVLFNHIINIFSGYHQYSLFSNIRIISDITIYACDPNHCGAINYGLRYFRLNVRRTNCQSWKRLNEQI